MNSRTPKIINSELGSSFCGLPSESELQLQVCVKLNVFMSVLGRKKVDRRRGKDTEVDQ